MRLFANTFDCFFNIVTVINATFIYVVIYIHINDNSTNIISFTVDNMQKEPTSTCVVAGPSFLVSYESVHFSICSSIVQGTL